MGDISKLADLDPEKAETMLNEILDFFEDRDVAIKDKKDAEDLAVLLNKLSDMLLGYDRFCEHGVRLDGYCMPCGRIHSA